MADAAEKYVLESNSVGIVWTPVPGEPTLRDDEVQGRSVSRGPIPPLERAVADVLRAVRVESGCAPDAGEVRSFSISFAGDGTKCVADYSLKMRRPVPAPPSPPEVGLTEFGLTWRVATAFYPGLADDHRKACDADDTEAKAAVAAGRGHDWSLFDPNGPAMKEWPSLRFLSALGAIRRGIPFRELIAAVLQARAVALVAALRAQFVPDPVILESTGLLEPALAAVSPSGDELALLRTKCRKDARETLGRFRVEGYVVAWVNDIVDRLVG